MVAPKVSIVIPTFNRANLVSRAIDSALAQTIPCEVLVCDHGSTDHTPKVAAAYGDRIKYVRREKDNGPIECWRDGIEQAIGEFVHLNYDDDWIDPKYIERTLPLLEADVAFVYSRVTMHFEGTPVTSTILAHPSGIRPSAEIAHFLLRNRLTISPGCALFRRTDLLKNLVRDIPGAEGIYGKNSGVGEDLLVFLLATLDYPSYAHLPESVAHFLAHPTSITVSAKISGQDRKLKAAYSRAKEFYRMRAGSVNRDHLVVNLKYAVNWWLACGLHNHLKSVCSFVFRRVRFMLFQFQSPKN